MISSDNAKTAIGRGAGALVVFGMINHTSYVVPNEPVRFSVLEKRL